jgi:hypothetical protein
VETIAVPELRTQASELAEHLARTLPPHIRNAHRVASETTDLDLATSAITEDVINEEPAL